jgi:sortase (surface protein transpeptidase)
MKQFLMRGGRRGLVATVAVAVFTASGATAIVLAVAAQKHAPQPPASAAGSLGPAAVSPTPSESSAAGSSPAPAAKVVGPVLPRSKPVSIDIPAIGVHSTLQYLGLTAQRTLQVPAPGPHYNEAAWYKYSPTPGSLGPAVISGHVDSAAQGPSVFYNLGDMRPGDNVLVTRADGLVAVFRVDGVRRYPKSHFPTLLVYGNTDHAALRLITCGGAFDSATGHYVDNIVVFASLVSSH